MSDDITLAIVLGAAAIDSINPCAIGVILFLSSALLRVSSRKQLLLKLGGIYITTVYVVYTLSGLGLIWFQYALIRNVHWNMAPAGNVKNNSQAVSQL